jgi:tripartite-type tricarboxylate transporter receptor subunit TctC
MCALGDVRRYVAAVMIAIGLLPAAAQEFPNKPITLVVAAAPGGGHDAVARAIAQNLKIALGWTVIVENRGGANGMIAAESVAKSTPDGYTILISTPANNYVTSELRKDMRFDPRHDLAPVTLASTTDCFGSKPVGESRYS